MSVRSVHVRVPATSANLGPGFDCLGLALDLWNEADLALSQEETRVEISGYGQEYLPQGAENLIAMQAMRIFSVCRQEPPPGLRISCKNRIPPGAGLGSSAAAVLAGLLAANALLGNPLSQQEILEMAAEVEGHPDNAAAALLGGLVITTRASSRVIARKVPIGPMQAAVVIPDFEFFTHQARAALPAKVPFSDAVFNLARTALTIEAFRSADFLLLSQAMQDRLHQPYRFNLIPGAEAARQAALAAGAASVALSGAGPSLIAFGHPPLEPVTQAMKAAFEAAGLAATAAVLAVTLRGAEAVPPG